MLSDRTDQVANAPEVDVGWAAIFDALPTPFLVLDTDLRIVAVNRARERVTGTSRADVVGRHLFEAFPDNPEEPDAAATGSLHASLRRVLSTGQTDTMPLQKYDIPTSDGTFTQRWWSPVNAPVLDDAGRVVLLIHRVEDVSEYVTERLQADRPRAGADHVGSSFYLRGEADLYLRGQELRAALATEAAHRLTGLVQSALAMTGAQTEAELTEVLFDRVLSSLGAAGGGLAIRQDASDSLRVNITTSLGAAAQRSYGQLPLASPLPGPVAARTGRTVLLRDREAGLAFTPQMAQLYSDVTIAAWAALPLRVGQRLLGSLSIGWDQPQEFTPADVELLEAVALQCAQALDRLTVLNQRREVAQTLQRAMLTALPQPTHLQLRAMYVPAADTEQVGGDWYDAVLMPGGAATLVIGDVVGHDMTAAATMGQLRSMTRTLAWTLAEHPTCRVLSAVDETLAGLDMDVLATCLVARVEMATGTGHTGATHQVEPVSPGGSTESSGYRVRWSSAGHPPPLLLSADGQARHLDGDNDPLLGVDADLRRHEHLADLPAGSTLLLFTDGLIERRERSLTHGLELLRLSAQRHAALPLAALLEEVIDELVYADALGRDPRHSDDVAVLAVRMQPEDPPAQSHLGGGGTRTGHPRSAGH